MAIPPLLPQPPDFLDDNFTYIPPLFTFPFPEMALDDAGWKTVSSWYFGSSRPFYFDMLCQDSKRQRFQITLKPDLSAASLHAINASEIFPLDDGSTLFQGYRICEDTLVSFWCYDGQYCGLYTINIRSFFQRHVVLWSCSQYAITRLWM